MLIEETTNVTPQANWELHPSLVEHRLSEEFVFNNPSTQVFSGQSEDVRREVPAVPCLAASLGMPGDFLRKSYDCRFLGFKPDICLQEKTEECAWGMEISLPRSLTDWGIYLSKRNVSAKKEPFLCLT